ncbi:MAG: hypothetical protein AB7I18_12225 [Candidatus Berkiella sp.]
MATQGITPNFETLAERNRQLSPIALEHAITHFLCKIPYFLATEVVNHPEILVLEKDGSYQRHQVVRLPLGVENHGYLLLPVDKQNHHIKAVFRGTDHFEKQGNAIDSFDPLEENLLTFTKSAILRHYGAQQQNLTMTIAGHCYSNSSTQFFSRALIKRYANSNDYDAIGTLNLNTLNSLEEKNTASKLAAGNSLTLLNTKPMTFNIQHFSNIGMNIIQQEAYDHIFKPITPTIADIEAANARLPETIRQFASAHLLSSYAYFLADKGFAHPKEVLLLKEDGTYRQHRVLQLPLALGMFGYIFLPMDRNDTTIRVAFRGTDFSDFNSATINLERNGPSSQSFADVKTAVMTFLKSAIRTHYGEGALRYKLMVSGHSQGSSTAQLFATALLEKRAEDHDFDQISELSITNFNDPGVSEETRLKADQLVMKQYELGKPMRIKASWGMVEGDVVQTLAQDMIFVRLPYPFAEVTLLKMDKELDHNALKCRPNGRALSLASIPRNILCSLAGAHSILSFFSMLNPDGSISPNKVSVEHNNRPYFNHVAQDNETMQAELLNKATIALALYRRLYDNVGKPAYHCYEFLKFCVQSTSVNAQDLLLAVYGANGYFAAEIGRHCMRGAFHCEPRAYLSYFKQKAGEWLKPLNYLPSFFINRNGILQTVEPAANEADRTPGLRDV